MEAKWIKIDKATPIYGGDFIRQFIDGDEYQYKIIAPSETKGFVKILGIGKNGIGYSPDKRTSTNIANWVLLERFEVLDEGFPKGEKFTDKSI